MHSHGVGVEATHQLAVSLSEEMSRTTAEWRRKLENEIVGDCCPSIDATSRRNKILSWDDGVFTWEAIALQSKTRNSYFYSVRENTKDALVFDKWARFLVALAATLDCDLSSAVIGDPLVFSICYLFDFTFANFNPEFRLMAQQVVNPDGEVVLGEEIGHVRLITLNRPRQLNVISSKVVSLLAECLEKWEKDDEAQLIIFKGAGRAFSAGGDLRMFYEGRNTKDSCLEVVYRMYWLCYHVHTYKKIHVALVHGLAMGGGASLMVPLKFSVVTEKTVFATPEASIGFHTDCGFSYMFSRLPGYLGEYLALTGSRLNGKELVVAGFATHFVPSEKLGELERRLISLNSHDETSVRSVIEEFSSKVQLDEDSVLKRQSVIDKCFSKETVAEIINSFEAEASVEGNGWIVPVLKGLKRSSPTGLKITLKSIREGRSLTLQECLKKEFRLTMNILRSVISGDVYEGIRALTIDKDNAPKWDPPSLDKVDDDKVNVVFQPFGEDLELQVPINDEQRWSGKYEDSTYAALKVE